LLRVGGQGPGCVVPSMDTRVWGVDSTQQAWKITRSLLGTHSSILGTGLLPPHRLPRGLREAKAETVEMSQGSDRRLRGTLALEVTRSHALPVVSGDSAICWLQDQPAQGSRSGWSLVHWGRGLSWMGSCTLLGSSS
jgi:hypothetical protein